MTLSNYTTGGSLMKSFQGKPIIFKTRVGRNIKKKDTLMDLCNPEKVYKTTYNLDPITH